MLDITTNQATNFNYSSYGFADNAAGLVLDDDMMDPLFEEDWLHENNLDILFDLFEEEIESKVGVDSNNASSALFGTSPVTSYLFGTSPSLASTLDLLYFDQPQTGASTSSTATATTSNTSTQIVNSSTNIHQTARSGSVSHVNGTKASSHIVGNAQQVSQKNVNGTNSITNAMRIKRGLKRGQSEGVSLLAKPFSSNNGKTNSGTHKSVNSTKSNINNNNNNNNNNNDNSNKINSSFNKNNSDKTSTKITNFKSSIIGNKNNENKRIGIEINYSKLNQQQNRERYYIHKCHQHIHYITGNAIMREHAYAVRGH